MNRWLIAVVLLLASLGFASAQDGDDGPRNIHVANVRVNRVYPHRLGYRVVYTRSDLYAGVVHLPSRWFNAAAGRGEIIRKYDDTVPYMEVYYFDGEFSHVRLYVHGSPTHSSWGALRSDEDLSDEFSSDTLEIAY